MNLLTTSKCPHYDSGWCYSPDLPEGLPCVGYSHCSIYRDIIATDKDVGCSSIDIGDCEDD